MIPNKVEQNNPLQTVILQFMKEFKIAQILKKSNCRKERGISAIDLFQTLFSLVFTGKSFTRFLQNDTSCRKDTYYRFLNSSGVNWRRFLWLLATQVIFKSLAHLTSEDRVDVLIVDDSLYRRSRSKSVEMVARVYDHVSHRFVRGFRMLTLGWSDGNSFIPLAFSLLSSEKSKNRLCSTHSNIDKRSNGYKRRVEAMKKSTEVLVDLLQQVHSYGISAHHILFDSWFAFPSVLTKVARLGYHPIAMLKKTSKVFYHYQGKAMSLDSIYASVKKKRGRAKILASVPVHIRSPKGEVVDATIVFVRDRNRSRQWLALITTDVDLPDEEVVRLYGKRWDIEVFFKMLKSHLKLAKEFQGRSYDSMVAHSTIVFSRYILLALEKRRSADPRTIGGLFYDLCNELDDIKFASALLLLLEILEQCIKNTFSVTEQQRKTFFDNFIADLPCQFKARLGFSVCES
ncbi:IS4 family transposase [Heliobacterium mobile]|nr:transposase [Heliobacterium mobile]